MTMQISTAFPSEYLRAADLQGKQVRVVIDRVELREVGNDGEHKPVLFFKDKDKGVVLNKTNATVIADAYGDDTDDWGGQDVVLFSAIVSFQGKNVNAIRLRVPTPKERAAVAKPAKRAAAAQVAPADENPAAGMNDEVPF
jgi:arabinogalactan endo-1,4-beta-galactosidase